MLECCATPRGVFDIMPNVRQLPHRSRRYVEQLPRSGVTPRTRAAAVSAVTCGCACNDVTRDVEHLRGVRSFDTASGGATRRDYDKVVGICPNNLSAPFVRIARGRAGIIPRNYSRPAAAALFRATVGQHSRIFANGRMLWAGRRWAKVGKRCRNGAETVGKSGQVVAAKEGK